MKKTFRLIMAAILIASVTFTGCKKSNDDNNNSDDNSSILSTHSDDYSRVSGASDDVANDANTAIEGTAGFEGRVENTVGIICNASTVLDSTLTDRRITITYNGLNCLGTRSRTGVVVLTMPLGQHWRDVGAVLTATIQNLKITRVSDGKSITINGTHTITNVTGGRLGQLALHGPIIHDIASPGMTVTFDDNTTRTWMVSKRRTFTYDNGIVITTVGTHTDGSTTGISEWGTNRFGNAFVTSITAPMIIRQDCGFRLTAGQVTHQRLVATVVVTFGLDATGNPTSCPGSGHYYFKLVWTGANGNVHTTILPY